MTLTCNHLNRRSNNIGVLVAIYCSMPWLYSSTSRAGSHSAIAEAVAACLVLGLTLVAFYLCRKRRTAA